MNRVSSFQREVSPSGNVPFSWEAKPGVSKPSPNESFADKSTLRLPPPPCRSESARFLRQINTKLTPDSSSSSSSRSESARFVDSNIWKTVSPPQRSDSGRFIFDESGFHFGSRPFLFQRLRYGKIIDVMNEEDPFFEAYKNCTNSPLRRRTVSEDNDRDNADPGPRKRSIFSFYQDWRAMSCSKVHSRGNVPFSWENKPGVSKMAKPAEDGLSLNLPLPPCPSETPRVSVHKLQIPLPPSTLPTKCSKGLKKQFDLEDPFLAAYMECTKGSLSQGKSFERRGFGARLQRKMSTLSCKRSLAVRDDNLIRVSPFH